MSINKLSSLLKDIASCLKVVANTKDKIPDTAAELAIFIKDGSIMLSDAMRASHRIMADASTPWLEDWFVELKQKIQEARKKIDTIKQNEYEQKPVDLTQMRYGPGPRTWYNP